MSARSRDRTRWMLLGATLASMAMTAGCAVDQGSRLARMDSGCPMSFTLVCEANRPGAEPVACRCVRNKHILPRDF